MGINVNSNDDVLTHKVELETPEISKNKIIYKLIKRIVDIIGGLVGTILLIPITIVLYIVTLFYKENKGPLFFEQLRIGKNGKEFRLYKFRSMVMHADEKLLEYLNNNPEAKEEYRKYKKLKEDPRITKLGKFLRKTSLDEFPQFINVLKGNMSLIGPRPLVKGELDAHNGNHEIYESVRPGISGWWAANGRSDLSYDERLKLEYYYAENFSLWLDIKCILKTIVSVIRKEGAK